MSAHFNLKRLAEVISLLPELKHFRRMLIDHVGYAFEVGGPHEAIEGRSAVNTMVVNVIGEDNSAVPPDCQRSRRLRTSHKSGVRGYLLEGGHILDDRHWHPAEPKLLTSYSIKSVKASSQSESNRDVKRRQYSAGSGRRGDDCTDRMAAQIALCFHASSPHLLPCLASSRCCTHLEVVAVLAPPRLDHDVHVRFHQLLAVSSGESRWWPWKRLAAICKAYTTEVKEVLASGVEGRRRRRRSLRVVLAGGLAGWLHEGKPGSRSK